MNPRFLQLYLQNWWTNNSVSSLPIPIVPLLIAQNKTASSLFTTRIARPVCTRIARKGDESEWKRENVKCFITWEASSPMTASKVNCCSDINTELEESFCTTFVASSASSLLFSGRILTTTCHEEFAAFVKSWHGNISSRHCAMSLHFHTQRRRRRRKRRRRRICKRSKDSAQDLQESAHDHNVTFSTFTPVSVASEDSIAVELIKASIPPPPAASILPKFSFLLVAVEGSRSCPIPKGWIWGGGAPTTKSCCSCLAGEGLGSCSFGSNAATGLVRGAPPGLSL